MYGLRAWVILCLLCVIIAIPAKAAGLDEVRERPDTSSIAERLMARAGFAEMKKSFALVVGVSEFDEFNDLPTSEDPVRMRDYLLEEAGFDYVQLLTEDKVTKERLEELMLDDFRTLVGESDRFLFYWSGHGETLERESGARGFLPLKNSRKGRFSTMVSMDDIDDWDSYLNAHQVLYLLDSCFSGLVGAAPQSDLAAITREQLSGRSRHVITAGRADEQTIAVDQLGGSVFTHALLKGLRGSADAENAIGKDGIVSVGELKGYLGQEVTRLRIRFGWQNSITPQIRDLSGSDGAFFFPIPAAFPIEPQEEMTPSLPIKDVQQALTDLGYDPGKIDGVLSLKTRTALILFQRDSGLVETGDIDVPTLEAIPFALAALVQPQGSGDDPGSEPTQEDPPDVGEAEESQLTSVALCENCPKLMQVPGGKLAYGPSDAKEAPSSITVDIAPFLISKTEVTIRQFREYAMDTGLAFVDAKTSQGNTCFAWQPGDKLRKTEVAFNQNADESQFDYPVSCVSYDDAKGYVSWLNDKLGTTNLRLPTEAEFELLLERQWNSEFFWMMESGLLQCELGNFGDASSQFSWRNKVCEDGHPRLATVASFPSDEFGVHDMAGNLWEWVSDCWQSDLYAPRRHTGCKTGTLKGGSFDDPVKNTAPETRQPAPVDRRQTNIGFRIARDLK